MTVFGGARRVPGLRREEVAQLVGVSTAYYTRMERRNLRGVSKSVLRSLARTLRMGEAETQHLFVLALAASDDTRARRAAHPSRRSAHGPKPSTSILIPSQHGKE
ncbi:helix-turn-helix transcriptional regulator [Streptomyces caniscabiei]|uniref:helix-turn-helix domain-containing protein n=1 Tax=Streptomyces caniscabiei TaxID=2746961 RepID=UPI0029A1F0EA|nr:helix-turn-helix transcriptional regulator [Streptomyces caniscabiei]MDX2600873.1 helix-turn-helix transcriptional regulator [Streptomyces caniscabiei]MDX2740722.1 helix-turn-helix transcriptional regulator [Streptomyces caniscabiei]MDX2776952.1 helix-turn-helix transcriptional regulator [Streptomyces caniscabiei]